MMQPCTIWGLVFVVCAIIVFVPYFDTTQRKTSGMFLGVMIAALFGMQSHASVAEIVAAASLVVGLCGYIGKGVQV